jgi:ABC-type multidrug transport system ATPase subunit
MTDEILVAKSISKSFGHLRVLTDLNISINREDVYVLFGSNGAGKTTLVKLLSTLLNVDSGEIRLFGMKPEVKARSIKKKIGLMSHKPYLYDELSALENLIFFAQLYSLQEEKKKALKMLKTVGLYHRAYDRVGTFSRGMKQRLAMARALLHDPDLIFLDEPYSGLDLGAQGILNKLIIRLNKEGKTFFIITHDINKGFEVAKKSGILSKGTITYEVEGGDLEAFSEKYKETLKGEGVERG